MKKLLLLFIPTFSFVYAQPPELPNCGNTCYLNATTQALLAVQPLTQFLAKNEPQYPRQSLADAYQEIARNISAHREIPLPTLQSYKQAATKLIRNLRPLEKGESALAQEDATEFLIAALDNLREYGNNKTRDLVNDLFTVTDISIYQCLTPDGSFKTENETRETFLYLVLPIENEKHDSFTMLERCLQEYTKKESLEQFRDKFNECIKQIKLYTTAPFIIFSPKRYRFDQHTLQTIKLNHPISIPLTINLQPYIEGATQPVMYNLLAAIIQYGAVRDGHYIAYVRYGNVWYLCDDSTIRVVDSSEVSHAITKGYAYIYERAAQGSTTALTPLQPLQPPSQQKLISDLTTLGNKYRDMNNLFNTKNLVPYKN